MTKTKTKPTKRRSLDAGMRFSTDRFELLLANEGMTDLRVTSWGDNTMDEIHEALDYLKALGLDEDMDNQPVVVPLLANGNSQFPDVPRWMAKVIGDKKGGGK